MLKVLYTNSDNIYALKCEDIVIGNYVGIRNSNLKQLAKKIGKTNAKIEKIQDSFDLASLRDIPKITEEQKQHIINVYLGIILETIPRDNISRLNRTQINVDNTEYTVNGYSISIDADTLKELKIKCLTKLQTDSTTLVLISQKLSALGLYKEYKDITKLSKAIAEYVSKIQSGEAESNDIMQISVYENKGKTIRTIISVNNADVLTIDKVDTDTYKKIIITENINFKNTNTLGEWWNLIKNDTVSQIIMEKTISDDNIANRITIVPDINYMNQALTINKSVSQIKNAGMDDITDIKYSIPKNIINADIISLSYKEKIRLAVQVEKILELKNSNCVIVNNYDKKQLVPFLNAVSGRTKVVLKDKMRQLGINLSI